MALSPEEIRKRTRATVPSPAQIRQRITGDQYQGVFRPSNIRKAVGFGVDLAKKAGAGIADFAGESAETIKQIATGEFKITPKVVADVAVDSVGTTFGLASDVAKGFNEGVVRFGKSGTDLLFGAGTADRVANSRYNPLAGLGEAATGKKVEDIRSFQEQGAAAKEFAKKEGSSEGEAALFGGGVIIGSIFLDNPLVGGGKAALRVSEEAIERLAKTQTTEVAERILREELKGASEAEIRKTAELVVAAKNRQAVIESLTQGTKRQIVAEATNPVEDLSRAAENSLFNDKTGQRDKSVAYFNENPAEITSAPIRVREIEDGRIVIEDGRHRLQAAYEKGLKNIEIEDVSANYTGVPSQKVQSFNPTLKSQVDQVLDEKQATKEFKDVGERVGGSKKEIAAIKQITVDDLTRLDDATAIKLVNKDRVLKNFDLDIPAARAAGGRSGDLYLKDTMLKAIAKNPANTRLYRDIYVEQLPLIAKDIKDAANADDLRAVYTKLVQRMADSLTPAQLDTIGEASRFSSSGTDRRIETAIEQTFGKRFQNLAARRSQSAAQTYADARSFNAITRDEAEAEFARITERNAGARARAEASYLTDEAVEEEARSGYNLFKKRGDPSFNDLKTEDPAKYESMLNTARATLRARVNRIGETIDKDEFMQRTVREDNFEWLDGRKGKTGIVKTASGEPKIHDYKPLDHISRVNGREVLDSEINPETITANFGFKSVQFGNAIKDVEAKEHVRHFLGSMKDMEDILEVDLPRIVSDGELSLAIAARGGSKASAHYEPVAKIINLTNKRGDGAIGHEMAHFFDHFAGGAKKGLVKEGGFISGGRGVRNFNTKMAGVSDEMDAAAKKLMTAINEGQSTISKTFEPSKSGKYFPSLRAVYEKDGLDAAIKYSKEKWQGSDLEVAMRYLALKEKKAITTDITTKRTQFAANAGAMKSDYWSRPTELLARAFQAYLDDKMIAGNIKNNYLTWSTIADSGSISKIHPQGIERVAINDAFDEFFAVLRKDYPPVARDEKRITEEVDFGKGGKIADEVAKPADETPAAVPEDAPEAIPEATPAAVEPPAGAVDEVIPPAEPTPTPDVPRETPPAAVPQETPKPKVKKIAPKKATADIRTAKTTPEGVKKAREEVNMRVSHTRPDGSHVSPEGEKIIPKTPAKAAKHALKKQVPLELPAETIMQRMQRRLQDKMNRLNLIQGKIVAKRGAPLAEDVDAYLQQELYVGRAAERIDRFERDIIGGGQGKKGLLERMKDDGIDLEEMGEYLHARHALERNAKVASINPDLPDAGSGMFNARAKKILETAKAKPALANYAEEIYQKITRARLKILEEEDLMTPEAIERIRGSYQNYVPLKLSQDAMPARGASGFDVRGKDVKRVKGSTKDRTNPLVQAIADYEDSVIKAEKNKVGRALKKLIEQNPDDAVWSVKAQQYKPVYNSLGEVEYVMPAGMKLADNVMEVREGGKIFHIEMKDPALAEAMRNLGTERGIKWLQTVNSYLRGVNTVFNPEFVITNFERDVQTALINVGGEQGAKAAAGVAKDIPAAMRGVWRETRGKGSAKNLKEGATDWVKEYAEMKEVGGRMGWFNYQTVEERTEDLIKRINRYSSDKALPRLQRIVDGLGEQVLMTNEAVESAVRLSAYVNAKKAGLSADKAAQIAKNLTVNFNKKGTWGTALNTFYLFANAGIQGSARIITALKHKRTRRIVGAVVAFSYGMAELNRAMNEEEYNKIPDYEKNTNLIIMLPPSMRVGSGEQDQYIKIKLPYGYNIFKVLGDIAYEQVHGLKTIPESMVRLVGAANDAFNPLSSGTLLQMATPTIADPIVQVYENKNFAGNPVKPEQPPYGQKVPESSLYFSTVRGYSKDIAEWLNDITGGTDVESGVIDVSPEYIDHFIDFIGGGVSTFAANIFESGISLAKGDMPAVNNMPFIRKFVGESYENIERSNVYDILDKSESKTISDKEKDRFKRDIKEALDEGQITKKAAQNAITRFKSNQARLIAGRAFERMLDVPKEERAAIAKELTPDQRKELAKIIKAYKEEKAKEEKKNGTASTTDSDL